jgi:hypothetical protein
MGVLAVCLLLTTCASMEDAFHWRMDGVVPFEYYQAVKKTDERLVYISPTLTPNQWFSNVYVITNSDDIQKANEKFENLEVAKLRDIEGALKEFSPVKIQSSADSPVGLRHPLGDGMGIFHLPVSVDTFFYVYIRYRNDIEYSSDYSTEVISGILKLPEGLDDVLIGFIEREDDMGPYIVTNPSEIKAYYDRVNFGVVSDPTQPMGGVYGWYLSKLKTQQGFIDIGFKERLEIVRIDPPPQNIAPPAVRERYTIPVTATLIGEYAKYNVITAHDIVGKAEAWQLSKDQILAWIELNKDNIDFVNALAICTIIADTYAYDRREFLCVDYCAKFIGIDAEANDGELESKTVLVMDDNHIWMQLNIPNKYYDANGIIRTIDYLWVDPTWFDNGSVYNFNNFTWGGEYVPQFMEGVSGGGDQCHKLLKEVLGINANPVVSGMTYSVVYNGGKYFCVESDFGRREYDR